MTDNRYWEWRRDLSDLPTERAIDAGFRILEANPGLVDFYPELISQCEELNIQAACLVRVQDIARSNPDVSAAHRLYALARLEASRDSTRSLRYVTQLMMSPTLTPGLARLIVDDAIQRQLPITIDSLRQSWHHFVLRESNQYGQQFGYAYILTRSNKWEQAEPLLLRLANKMTHDSEVYRELGRIYFARGQRIKCLEVLQHALHASRTIGDLKTEFIILGNIAYLKLRWEGPNDMVKDLLSQLLQRAKSVNDRQTIGITYFRLGELEARRSNYNDALSYLNNSTTLSTHNTSFMIQILSTKGEVLRRLYRFDDSKEIFNKALQLADNIDDKNSRLIINSYIIQLYKDVEKTQLALDVSHQSIIMADSNKIIDFQIMFRILYGSLLSDEFEFSRAIDIYKEALHLAQLNRLELRVQEITLELGRVYACIGNLDMAKDYYEHYINTTVVDSIGLANAYYGIANIYFRLNNFDVAKAFLDNVLDLLSTRDNSSMLSGAYQLLAQVAVEHGDFYSANEYFDEAANVATADRHKFDLELARGFAAIRGGSFDKALTQFAWAERFVDVLRRVPYGWRILHGKAIALWKLGRGSEAEYAFSRAAAEVERQLATGATAIERSLFAATRAEFYEEYSAFMEEQRRFEEAIGIGERGRSRTLVDLLYTTQRSRGKENGAPVEAAINAVIKSRAIEEERSELISGNHLDESAITRATYLAKEQIDVNTRFDKLEQDLRGTTPLYTFSPISADEARQLLRPDEAILLYSVRTISSNDRGSSVAYVIRQDTIEFIPLAINEIYLEEQIRFFRDAITTSGKGPGKNWEPVAKKLYDLLIRPALPSLGRSIRHLHIIPEGPLHYLPFAALQDEGYRFLIQDFDLSYAPSLTVLKLCRERNPMKWSRMLLMADPAGDLPGAYHEVSLIAAKNPERRTLAVGADATQKLLEEEASKYDVIHLATHGSFKARLPLASHLKLRDDILTVDEIGQLHLNAYLVTLSACETALSGGLVYDSAPGEEWIGFNQAFLAAGTPSVMASLWRIHDRYSGPLMGRFYDHLGSEGKAGALANVQRGYIMSEKMRHPYYWAAFTVIGDPL